MRRYLITYQSYLCSGFSSKWIYEKTGLFGAAEARNELEREIVRLEKSGATVLFLFQPPS
jgi:hypothetical protein